MRGRHAWVIGQVAIVGLVVALIVFAWLGAFSAITAEREGTEARAEAAVGVEALALGEQVRRQLLALDQTLRFLRREQEANPSGFDLAAWAAQATLLSEISGTLFLVDDEGIVRAASGPTPAGLPTGLDINSAITCSARCSHRGRYLARAGCASARRSRASSPQAGTSTWQCGCVIPTAPSPGQSVSPLRPRSSLDRFFRDAHLQAG